MSVDLSSIYLCWCCHPNQVVKLHSLIQVYWCSTVGAIPTWGIHSRSDDMYPCYTGAHEHCGTWHRRTHHHPPRDTCHHSSNPCWPFPPVHCCQGGAWSHSAWWEAYGESWLGWNLDGEICQVSMKNQLTGCKSNLVYCIIFMSLLLKD